MRIGLISDTHIPLDAEELPRQLRKIFSGVDLILHAGDIYRAYVLDELQTIAPVLAAMGDDDPTSLAIAQRAKTKHILRIEDKTLWLIHQRPYFNIVKANKQNTNSAEEAADKVDVIVFGHEHSTCIQEQSGVLLVNSGSPTFLHYQRGMGTVAILEISAGKAEAHIVPVQNTNVA